MYSYEINEDTLAIISKNYNTSVVFEKKNRFIIYKGIDSIINDSCKYYGSSYEGRKVGSSNLLKVNYKVPIVIEESSNMIFFPTGSSRNNRCCWLSLNNIDKFERYYRGSKVLFNNGFEMVVPISYRILNNQILRSTRLAFLLKERKINKK